MALNFQSITFGETSDTKYPVIASPHTKVNLRYGCKPSHSLLRLRTQDLNTFLTAYSTDPKGDITIHAENPSPLVLPNMYLLETVADANLDSTLDPYYADAVFADERILWTRLLCDKNWNMSNDTAITNLSSAASFSTILTYILQDLLGYTTDDYDITAATGLTSKPFQLLAHGRSCADILEDVLFQASCWLAFNPHASSPNKKITLYSVGYTEVPDDYAYTTTHATKLVRERKIERIAGGAQPESITFFTFTNTGEGNAVDSISCTGGKGIEAYLSPFPDAFLTSGELTTYANEIIAAYANSYALPIRDHVFGNFLDGQINKGKHELTWQLQLTGEYQGATTRVQAYRPVDQPSKPPRDTHGTHDRYFAGSSVTIDVIWYTVIEAPEYADPESFSLAAGRAYYTLRASDDTTPTWLDTVDYVVDALAIDPDDNLQYKAILASGPSGVGAKQPKDEATYWTVQEEIRIEHALGNDGTDLRLFIPWFAVDGLVPVIAGSYSGSPRNYIWMALTPTGTDAQASLRWNQDETRSMACFK